MERASWKDRTWNNPSWEGQKLIGLLGAVLGGIIGIAIGSAVVLLVAMFCPPTVAVPVIFAAAVCFIVLFFR